jgi:hypothetical protein
MKYGKLQRKYLENIILHWSMHFHDSFPCQSISITYIKWEILHKLTKFRALFIFLIIVSFNSHNEVFILTF